MPSQSTLRDVLLAENGNQTIVTAVDSCGGIGALSHDVLKTTPKIVGMYTARVCLMEVLSAGAAPLYATLAVSNAPDYATEVLDGVRSILGESLPCAISTEKNMTTVMTGIGVTVSGICGTKDLRLAKAQAGDAVYCLGLPLVGAETLAPDAPMISADMITHLLSMSDVHAVIPVGSHGIEQEARLLAKESALCAELYPNQILDLTKSAGPSSCAVFTASETFSWESPPVPITKIGILR